MEERKDSRGKEQAHVAIAGGDQPQNVVGATAARSKQGPQFISASAPAAASTSASNSCCAARARSLTAIRLAVSLRAYVRVFDDVTRSRTTVNPHSKRMAIHAKTNDSGFASLFRTKLTVCATSASYETELTQDDSCKLVPPNLPGSKFRDRADSRRFLRDHLAVCAISQPSK
jgi:hypothetical protein